MAQTAAKRRFDSGDVIEHTPASAVAAGDVVVVFGGIATIAPSAIDANVKGVVECGGIWDVPKTDDVFAVGDYVFWNAAATDVGANTGGAENVGSNIMGVAVDAAVNTATHVRTRLLPAAGMARHPVTAITAAGANIATAVALSEGENLVTASDNTKGVQLPSCVDGKRCVVINFVTDKTLKVYPPEGKQVNLAGANNAIAQAANTRVEYVSEGANAYYGS
jgi:predicted RecA/RadA family phage recombinase